jgi:hypothetical protein
MHRSHHVNNQQKWNIEYLDTTLRSIVKLSQTTVTFSVSDGIVIRWLNSVYDLDMCQEVFHRCCSFRGIDHSAQYVAHPLPISVVPS